MIEFHSSSYKGDVKDEFGFSDITYNQWARVRFRVFDSNGQVDTIESAIFNVIGSEWGGDASWNKMVAKPIDQHWFYFRTTKSFAQGSLLLLEAGIRNVTWFISNDESIKTFDDIDLKLKHIMVRTCRQKPTVHQ